MVRKIRPNFQYFLLLLYCTKYKGSAPRAADAARYARARQGRMQLKTCIIGGRKRPMIWCEQLFNNAKKSCLEQIITLLLCSAVLCAFVTGVTF